MAATKSTEVDEQASAPAEPAPEAQPAEPAPEAQPAEPTLTVSPAQLAELVSAQVALAVGEALAAQPKGPVIPFQGIEFTKPDGPMAVMTIRTSKTGVEVQKVCVQFVPMMEALGWSREDQD